jgi:hypothetical protein
VINLRKLDRRLLRKDWQFYGFVIISAVIVAGLTILFARGLDALLAFVKLFSDKN